MEPEYIEDTFEDEMVENEDDDDDEMEEEEEQPREVQRKNTRNQTKKGAKRTYPYKCAKCNKRFVYKEVYEAHIRIHKGLPGFSCPHCPKTFNEKANFDYHMQDHTGLRPAKCHLCEKSFKNKQDLASHIRCHKVSHRRISFSFTFSSDERRLLSFFQNSFSFSKDIKMYICTHSFRVLKNDFFSKFLISGLSVRI